MTSAVAERLRSLVAARNREAAMHAAIEVALGVLFSALTFGAIFSLTWIFTWWWWGRPTLMACVVTGVYAVVATWTAWRGIDPLAKVPPMTQSQLTLTMLSIASPYIFYTSPRHAVAGSAMVLIAGPANIFEGWSTWRGRLPDGTDLLARAAALLKRAERGVPIDDRVDVEAARLLYTLRLVRAERTEPPRIVLTTKGREVAGAV